MRPWLFGLMLLVACGSKRAALDTRPLDQLTSDQLAKEKKDVAKGENVGALLRSPHIVVTPTKIDVNDLPVVDRANVTALKGGYFVGLSEWLSGLKDHWTQIHSERFDPSADVTFPGETSTTDAAIVLWSVAHGGYAHGVVVHAGDATARFTALGGDEANTGVEVALYRVGADWMVAEVNPVFDFGFLRPGDAPERCTPAKKVDPTTVAAAVTAICDQRGCGEVALAGATDLHDAIAILGPALSGKGVVDAFVAFEIRSRCQ